MYKIEKSHIKSESMMKKIIAFAGKGGVGKTTSLALFLKYILAKNLINDKLGMQNGKNNEGYKNNK